MRNEENNEIKMAKLKEKMYHAESKLINAYCSLMAVGITMLVTAIFAQEHLVIGVLVVVGLILAFTGLFKARGIADDGVVVPNKKEKK